MGHRIESDALDILGRQLDVPGLSGDTLIDSDNVSLIKGIDDVVRRSRTPGFTTGWFHCVLQNVHAAAGTLNSNIDPYNPGAAVSFAPYPATVRRGFDFWILTASIRRTAGAGTLDGAQLFVDPTGIQQGWGRNNSGTVISTHTAIPIGRWGSLDLSTGVDTGIAGDGGGMISPRLRIGRGALLSFSSDVAAASATITLLMLCGLFPEALGQDVAS